MTSQPYSNYTDSQLEECIRRLQDLRERTQYDVAASHWRDRQTELAGTVRLCDTLIAELIAAQKTRTDGVRKQDAVLAAALANADKARLADEALNAVYDACRAAGTALSALRASRSADLTAVECADTYADLKANV